MNKAMEIQDKGCESGGSDKGGRTNKTSASEDYITITLDIQDEVVSVHVDEQEASLLEPQLPIRRQVRPYRSKTAAARALSGLWFINKSMVGKEGWVEVEKQFAQLHINGLLSRSRFGQCIGMKEKEFGEKLFDTLARRSRIVSAKIAIDELFHFWEQLSDPSYDTCIQIYFDMVDKNDDGRITEEEVKEIISLSAAANQLSQLQDHVDEYAALIIEELDPYGLGYSEIHDFERLLVQALAHSSKTVTDSQLLRQGLSQKLVPTMKSNPVKRTVYKFGYFVEDILLGLRSGYNSVQIIKVAVYPGKVLLLQMIKPQGFKYTGGQYIFIKCADVSPFEWHPFFLTSAPEDDYISVHIRTLGDWTSRLRELFSMSCQPPRNDDQSRLVSEDIGNGSSIPRMPRLKIDGPYGASAHDYRKYDVLLLVGLGIGATPLISIVKDVLYHIKQQKDIVNGIIEGSSKRKLFQVKKAYFYWVTREQGSFEWFRSVMNEVSENDRDNFIELHNYCTSVYEEGDARSALIAMLQYIQHTKNGVDIVSGCRVKTHFARPNWMTVFKHVAASHNDKRVGVFYCGTPGLTQELRHLSRYLSRKTSTKFDFHNKNF